MRGTRGTSHVGASAWVWGVDCGVRLDWQRHIRACATEARLLAALSFRWCQADRKLRQDFVMNAPADAYQEVIKIEPQALILP